MFGEMDADGDSRLDRDVSALPTTSIPLSFPPSPLLPQEFVAACARLHLPLGPEEAAAEFDRVDCNGGGQVGGPHSTLRPAHGRDR
jgi:hypothetical protein